MSERLSQLIMTIRVKNNINGPGSMGQVNYSVTRSDNREIVTLYCIYDQDYESSYLAENFEYENKIWLIEQKFEHHFQEFMFTDNKGKSYYCQQFVILN